MRFSILVLAQAILATSVLGGGVMVCTNNKDGGGGTNYQVTKDCCAAVNHKAFFNELFKYCSPNSGPPGNSVDTGAMVKCCSSRGAGSHSDRP
ncbi:hypothetical protein PQX77_021711 [Marasmius sp. AFHP31]|nr:hypothetical protein PQX77_021711 [Marasmius sp. AFHP31]